ncbi:MAG TPA: hypothetical protein VGP72_00180 [Planctomycetota bacterium]|jgi:hypothetical protein
MLGWTAALILPNLLLLWWWFRFAAPQDVLGTLYLVESLPLEVRLPLGLACIGVLAAILAKHLSAVKAAAGEMPRRWPLFMTAMLAIFFVLLACISWSFARSMLAAGTGVVIVAAALALGLRLLNLPLFSMDAERFASPLERLVLAGALGMGSLAIGVFVAGSCGLLQKWFWWPLLVLLVAQGTGLVRDLFADLRSSAREYVAYAHPVALAAVVFTVGWCLVHLPLLWSPPLEYDVLEYHLAAPAQYLRDGRITFLRENLYATFAQNGEMLYLLGLLLSPDKLLGLPAAHMTLFAAWALSICGVYALSARLTAARFGQSAGPDAASTLAGPAPAAAAVAALLFALVPLSSQLVSDFYVEHFQALFHLAAVMAACGFLFERCAGIRDRFGWLTLCGVLAGLCCGTKYTALLFTLAPLLLLVPIFCLPGGSIYEALSAAGRIGLPAGLTLAPWLLRNLIFARDPVYPLGTVLMRRLAGHSAPPDHLTHFDIATRPGERSFSAFGRVLASLWPGFSPAETDLAAANLNPEALEQRQFELAAGSMGNWRREANCGPQLLCFGIPGVASILTGLLGRTAAPLSARARGALWASALVALVLLVDLALWFLFTYRLDRFLYPLLSLLAVLAAVGIAQLWAFQPLRKVVGAMALAAVVILAPLSTLLIWWLARADAIIGKEDPATAAQQQYERFGNRNWFESWRAINALPSDAKVLFIGDAQTFYLDRTPAYSVVFSPHVLERVLPFAQDGQDAAEMLVARGITHLYINYPEWLRLDTSYALRPAASGKDFQLARLDSERQRALRLLLSNGRLRAYAAAWPADTYAAYLKIGPPQYAVLEDLLKHFTTDAQAFPDASGAPTCQLRRIEPFLTAETQKRK